MSSTYTSSNGLEKIATGEQSNVWGASVDNDYDLIDQSLDGTATISLTGLSSYSLVTTNGVTSNGRCRSLVFGGTPTGTVSIAIPAVPKWYFVQNTTSQSLIFSCGGASYTLPPLAQAVILCDGTNVSSSLGTLSVVNITTSKLIGSGASASCVLGAGAGTGAVLTSFAGNDVRGVIGITAGSGGTPFSPIVTVTYGSPFSANAVVFLANYGATPTFISGNNTSKFDIIYSAALANGTPYQWSYLAVG